MPPEFDEDDIAQIRDTLDDMDQLSLPVTIHTSIGRVKVFPDGRAYHTTKQVWVNTGFEDEI